MDISFLDEAFNREHRDVLDELSRDRPSALETALQNALVYAEVAEREYRAGFFSEAHAAQETAMRAYGTALELARSDSGVGAREGLEVIRRWIDRNRDRFALV
jgi:predicted TPR repeat methyltransferase